MANKKPLNQLNDPARRKSSRLEQKRGESSSHPAPPNTDAPEPEEEASSDYGDPASQQLMDQMNLAAGKSSAEKNRRSTRSLAISASSSSRPANNEDQEPKLKNGKRSRPTRAEDNDDDGISSPAKRRKGARAASSSRISRSGIVVDVSASSGGPVRKTKAAARATRNESGDPPANIADDQPVLGAPQHDSTEPATRRRTKRQLNKAKKSNASPLKGHGVVRTSTARGVNLGDGSATPKARRSAKKSKSVQKDDEYQPDADAKADGDEAEANQEVSSSPLARRPQVRRDRDRDEVLRQELRQHMGHLIQLHDCAEHWETLLVAQDYIKEATKNCAAESDIGKSALWAVCKAHRLYKREGAVDWAAAGTATANAMQEINSMREFESTTDAADDDDKKKSAKQETANRGQDLYQCIIPRLVHMLKTILSRLEPTHESKEDDLAPLLQMLDVTWQTLERARKWEPRPPTPAAGGILGLTRRDIAMNVKHIQEAYAGHVQLLRQDEARRRAQEFHQKRKADWQEMNRREIEERDRRIRTAREAAQRQLNEIQQEKQRPLRDITRQVTGRVHDIDDFSDGGQSQEIYQEPLASASTSVRHLRPWTPAESGILLKALQEVFMKENRFSEIHRLHSNELGGRSIDDIMRQAAVIKHSMMSMVEEQPPEERKYWRWITSIPG